MIASTLVSDLRALPERSLILELARTEDALRGTPPPHLGCDSTTGNLRDRFAVLSYQQRIVAELHRRRPVAQAAS